MTSLTPATTTLSYPNPLVPRYGSDNNSTNNNTSTGSIVGYAFFGLFTIWFWGTILVIILAIPVLIVLWIYRQTLGRIINPRIGPPLKRRRDRRQRQRIERSECIALQVRRERQRRTWASEDLQRARTDGGRRVHAERPVRDVVRDLERGLGSRSKTKFGFPKLPAELRLQIYADLDYGTALRLEQVCRFFRNDVPAQGVDREQRATYLYHAETFAKNKERLACFSCLRILPLTAFMDEQRRGEYARFGVMESERICFECQMQKGHVPWTRRWRWMLYKGLSRLHVRNSRTAPNRRHRR